MSTNLLRCFDEEHPKYPPSLLSEAKNCALNVQPSSPQTGDQQPPKLLVSYSQDHWIQVANQYLRSTYATTHPDFLSLGSIASPELAMAALTTAQDVDRVANHYLIMPIQQAIHIKYPSAYISVGTETKQDRSTQLSFNIHQDDESKKKTIMTIMFKRPGVIKPEEFEAAACEESEKAGCLEKLDARKMETAITPSLNAFCLTKQAAAYAQQGVCDYVALCDYDNLVLLHFNDGLESARITVVERKDFRKALLGFLIEACDTVGLT